MDINASSRSSLPSADARSSRMTSPAAVKNLVGWPSTHALRASATARCVLPVPGGPNSTTSSLPETKSNDSNASRP